MRNRLRVLGGLAVFMAAFANMSDVRARAQGPSTALGAGRGDTALTGQFLGMWRLVSWTQRAADGATRPGPANAGYIIYTDVGRMCAVLMDAGRAKWTPGPPATVAEATARSSGFISYCSAVEVHAAEGFVLHHVDVERSPNLVGTTRKRWFVFDGADKLSLRIDPSELGSGLTESTLRWERVRK